MKKKAIILTIITIIAIGIITLGVCWRNKNVKENSNLISCGNHIDEDQNMLCDNCGVDLSKSGILVKKSLTQNINEKQKVEIEGNMPAQSELTIKEVDENKSQEIAQKIYKDSKVIASYEIGINNKNQKYQPEKQGEKVIVKISGLELEEDKTYVILHMEDNNKKYEKINIKKIGKDTVEFKARSFSTYILVEINEYFVTFEGNGNFKVKTNAGVEVESGEQLLISDFSNFTVEPEDGYVVYGEIELIDKNGKITILDKKVSNLTTTYTIPTIEGSSRVKIRTTFAPKITEQPKITKAVPGEPVSFTVKSQYTQRYQWQYKEPGINIWKNIEGTKIGIVESDEKQSKLIITNVTKANTAFEYRCLLINNGCNTEETAVKTNPVMAIYTTTSELDVKYTGEVLEDITGKILISGDLEYGATLIVDTSEIKPTDCNLTYKWYSNSIASTENGTQIKTGTNTYQITKAEIGKYIYVEVVATKDGYNERTIKAITYDTVGKMIIQKPKVSGEYIYTGTEQTVQLENYNTATMTASNITRINSGKQVVTVSLKDSSIYSWEDQTTADVKLEWEIKKLDRTLTIEKSVELEQGKTTILTYKYDGENADVYVKNDNETVISVTNTSTTNGGTLTIVGKEIGKANITINVKETTNYGDVNASIECQVVKAQADTAAYMITEWTIPAANTTIKLPVQGTGLNITVDWGDGSSEQTVTTALPTHTYATAGTYEIKVWGTCPRWGYSSTTAVNSTSDYYTYTQYLTKVTQLGELNATKYGFAKCANLTEISGENLVMDNTFANVTDMSNMFNGCSNLTTIDLIKFDTSKVTNMSRMFADCKKLTNVELSKFDTSKVTNMSYMFSACTTLKDINLSSFNTENVSNMSGMFSGCTGITTLDFSKFSTPNLSNMSNMFQNCTGLTSLDLSTFITPKLTSMANMFRSCSKLTSLNISNINTSKVSDMSAIFISCSSLTSLDLSNFDTTKATNMSWMLYGCSKLNSIQISNKFKIATYISNMLSGTSKLKTIIIVGNTPLASQFTSVKAQLNSKIFYVPDEEAYETSWAADFSGDRIEPILKLSGETNIELIEGEIYTEAGYTLPSDAEEIYGYKVTTSGEVNTAKVGTYKIEYILTRTYTSAGTTQIDTVMTAERTVIVKSAVKEEAKMITEWTIPSANTTIKLPVPGTGLNITVDWGDGSAEQTVTTSFPTHTYATAGTYEIKVWGTCSEWGYTDSDTVSETSNSEYYTYTQYLTRVKQFGELGARLYGFAQCTNLIEVSGDNLVTDKTFENIKYMAYMFYNCSALTSLDVSNFGTSKVTSMLGMFYNCSNLTSLDVSGFDTSKVTDMSLMFYYCSKLTSLDVSRFDTSKVTDMSWMFSCCSNLTSLDVSGFDTSNVTTMARMFFYCSNLTSLDVSKFNTSNVTTMSYMFYYCSNLTSLDVSGFDTSNVTTMASMFSYCSNLTSLDVSGFDTSNVTNMSWMFSYCSNLTSLDVSKFNTSNVTTMARMFFYCSNLTSLDVSGFDTSKVTDMSYMFRNCSKLTSLDVSRFDTSKVTDMTYMFSYCSNLTSLDVSGFDTSNVTNMSGMFNHCSNLTSLDVSKLDTSNVTKMSSMFIYCSSLTNLDISNFDTSKVTNMSFMFFGCKGLTNLDLNSFDTAKVTDMAYMFDGCSNLNSLQLSNKFKMPTSNITDMFPNTTNLKSIILVDSEPLASQFTPVVSQLDGKTIYVPNKVAETAYEESWSGDFSGDRIQPILELVGKENITLNVGNTYTDAGYTVAGFDKTNSGDYTVYGYNVTTSGEVNTTVVGTYKIDYTLTRTYDNAGVAQTDTLMSVERTVTVEVNEKAKMITEWTIPAANTTIKLPAAKYGSTSVNIVVDWGDGTTVEAFTTDFPTHTYATAGTYEIKVWGTCPEWGYANNLVIDASSDYYTYTQYLTKVKQLGELNAKEYGFAQCGNLTEVSGENLVTSKTFEKVIGMSYMFASCTSLTSLDVSKFDTSNVTSMHQMFNNCSEISNLDVSNFDTSNVRNMGYMFCGCTNLIALDVSKFDTSKVTYMTSMFYNCWKLTSLDVSNFNTSRVTNMSYMFAECSNLTSLDVSNFDTSKVTNMSAMFYSCRKLTSLNLSNFNTSRVTDMSLMFDDCRALTSFDVNTFDTSKVTSMPYMFANCKGLTKLDVSKFNTSNVTDMTSMFNGCSSLTNLDVSKFDTSKVTRMRNMFSNCSGLTSLDVSGFDTSNVTDMTSMFNGCSSLTSLDVSKFDTSKVTNMSNMFSNCGGLSSLDVSKFDTSKVTIMSRMFYYCNKLRTLQLSNKFKIPTSNNTNIFANTTSLNSLILVDNEPLASQFTSVKDQLIGKTFYVPNKIAEATYETAWTNDFTADRIEPILKLVGDENVTIKTGDDYIDTGYTVAGFDKTNSGDYTVYGYNVTTSGEVNTAVVGKYTIEYILTRTYNNGTETVTEEVMREIRTVNVVDTASYMITEWNVSGDAGLTITLPVSGTGLNITVDWGDGTESEVITTAFPTHTYATTGIYEISVLGNCPVWGHLSAGKITDEEYSTYIKYLTKVKQFGELNAKRYGFTDCENLTEVKGATTKTTQNLERLEYMFNSCTSLTSVDLTNFKTENIESFRGMFLGCKVLANLNISDVRTNSAKYMARMFESCESLSSIDLSNFITDNVSIMSRMFFDCKNISTLDLSSFNTSNVEKMDSMFGGCTELNEIKFGNNFNTNKVTAMDSMFSGCRKLKILDLTGFDTSNVTNMRSMFNSCVALKNLNVTNFDTGKVTDFSFMFYNMLNIETLDISNFDTRSGDTLNMFVHASKLKSIQIGENFVVPEATTEVFQNCSSLTAVITTSTIPVENQFKGMLPSTATLYVPNGSEDAYRTTLSGDTDEAKIKPILEQIGKENITLRVGETYTEQGYTVAGFTEADSDAYTAYGYGVTQDGTVDTTQEGNYKITYTLNKDEEKVADAVRNVDVVDKSKYMITEWNVSGDAGLTIKLPAQGIGLNITVDWGDGSDTETFTTAFPTHTYATTGIYEISVLGNCPVWGKYSGNVPTEGNDYYTYAQYLSKVIQFGELNATYYGFTWCTNLTDVKGATVNSTKNVTDMSFMFARCDNLTNLDTSNFDTSKVTNMIGMFTNCRILKNLDVSSFNISNVTNTSNMFSNCEGLTNLDVSNFNTLKVIDMAYMFYGCNNLKNLNLSNFDTLKVTNMAYMFYGCNNLTELNLSNFNTSRVTNMTAMFNECSSLINLDVTNFDTSKVTQMWNMFNGCKSLNSIKLNNFDTSSVETMNSMFFGCNSLKCLDLSGFDTSKVTMTLSMFASCSNLKSIQISNKFKIPTSRNGSMFTNTTNLKSIIIVDSEPLASQFTSVKDQLTGKTIYVPNKVAETAYEESWSGDFTADRIQPILELVGKENITLNVGNTYTDAGYTVAGFDKTNSGDYTVYGYNVTTSGEVNTAVAGKYTIEYILTRTHNNGTGTVTEEIMKATRTVEVIDTASYMITEWTIPSANTTIKLPVQGTGLNITVDWGDGSAEQTVTTAFPTHIYAEAGTYEIKVRGNCPEWGYASSSTVSTTSDYYTYTQYLTKVKQFGELNATRYGFARCTSLTEVSGENLVTSKTFEKVTSMEGMFYNCEGLINLDLSNFDTSKVTSMSRMFDGCSRLTNLDVSGFDTSQVTSMYQMFYVCSSLTNLDLSGFNTSKVTNMGDMFYHCSSLTNLDVSRFDTSSVTYMGLMFADCSSLTNLDVSRFDTSKVTNMGVMFYNCEGLTNLDVSGFNTSKVTEMGLMFAGCSSLTNLDVSGFDTSNVTSMQSMFRDCSKLTNLDVSRFNTSQVTDMISMFDGCSSLTNLDVSRFNTSKVTDMYVMFSGCSNLKTLQLSNKFAIPTSNATNMFTNTTNLNSIILVDNTPLANQFTSIKDQLDGKTIYVPNKAAEAVYEEAWSGDFTADRIQPILELVGKENITLNVGNTYTDAGYTVAGFDKINSGDYTVYGYNVTTSGEVNTAVVGTYKIEYILTRTYNNGTGTVTEEIMKATRTVEVVDTASYMITEWNVSGDAGLTITLPVSGAGLNITVDWGDGTESEAITTAFPTHTYATTGIYEISILGNCPVWGYSGHTLPSSDLTNYYTYTQYLTKVKQLGELNASKYGFARCEKLTEVSGENLVANKTFEKNVTDMSNMFYFCSGLTSLDVSKFDTSKVTNMRYMFYNCSKLTSLDVSGFDTSNVKNMGYMFAFCSSLTDLNISNFETSNVTDMYGMFAYDMNLTNLDISSFKTSKVTTMSGMFLNCVSLTSVDVSNFDTSNVVNMNNMFYNCKSLTNIDVSNFDTNKVTTMSMMFFSCENLTNIDVSNFNTSNVKIMEGMFGKCRGLESIDVTKFDTSKVTNMAGMFDNCESLATVDVTNFDTSKVNYMLQMFSSCSKMTNLDLSNFDTSSITSMSKMFDGTSNLKSILISDKFIISGDTTDIFNNCTNLTAIIDTSTTPVANQFKGMLPATATLYVPNGSEDAYKTTLSGDTVEDKIKPLLGLVGNDEENVDVGETYTDAGYTVAGFTKADSGAYTCYGYSVSSSGDVNTAVAGKYKITYKVTRTYEKDGQTITTQPYEVTREITVMALPLTKPTLIGTYTYNGLIQTAQLKTVNESRFEITNNTRKDAGTQEITVSIKDKNTYAWEDGTTDDIKITWEIKPIIAEITWSATTIEYDGTEKTVTATVSNAVNGEVITVTEYEGTTTATDVGEYTAKVKSLSSTNYTLEGAVNTEKKWYIQVTVIDMQVIMKNYSYGGTLPTPNITNNSAGRKVTYYYSENDTNQGGTDWSTVKDSLALPVGTYYMYAIVEANQNYQETLTDPVSFKVLGTELKVSVTKENKIEYEGNWVNQNVYIYITVEGNANVTAYQYKIGANGSWIDQVTSPVLLQNNMNGEVIVRGVNPAGKAVTSEKSAGLIKIDKTAPSITNVSYKNENKELSITATINDNLSGITAYAITAENGIREWIESTQGTKQAIVDGSGTYTIWAKDEAGNIGHETIDVVKDIHAPVGTIIVKDAYTVESNIYYTNQMNVILQITATDDISTSNQIKMAIYKEDDYNALTSEDEIVWEQYEENKQWTLTKENADEKIYLILKDMAGNISVKVGE